MDEATNERIAAALQEARKRIEDVREGRLSPLNEQNTKATLIEPLLEALGWDVRDPKRVFREWRRRASDNPVDYALFLSASSPCLLLEAKDLGQDVSERKWVSQVVKNAAVAGVQWCVVTNGDEYRIYNALAKVDVDEKLFRSCRISESSKAATTVETLELLSRPSMVARKLDGLWESHFVDRRVEDALQRLLEDRDKKLASLVRSLTPDLTLPQIKESLGRTTVRVRAAAAEPVPSISRAPEEAQVRKQQFRWDLSMEADGRFELHCVYLPDPTRSFRVRGVKVPPDQDFKPHRTRLFNSIYEQISPLFADLDTNLVRAKAWSGVHRVYPAKDYGKR